LSGVKGRQFRTFVGVVAFSGFPITNVGNDRRGSLVGSDGRGSFCMEERDADDVLDGNHEA